MACPKLKGRPVGLLCTTLTNDFTAYSGGLQEKYGDKIEKILYGPEEDGYAVGSLKNKKKPIIFRQAPEPCCYLLQIAIGHCVLRAAEPNGLHWCSFLSQPPSLLAAEAARCPVLAPTCANGPCVQILCGSGHGVCWLVMAQ